MERALRTLGMALHVAGDAYAHKAVIPDQITFPSDMNKELSKSIQDHGIKTDKKEKFKIERKKGITSSGWDGYSQQNTKDSHSQHADNPSWLPHRFQKGAIPTVNLLMLKFYNKTDFSVNVFYHPEDRVRQYRLYTYVSQAKGGEKLKSDWADYSRCD